MKFQALHFLIQPYPLYYQGKVLWTLGGILFTMTFGFNYFFEPFNVYVPEHKMSFFWISIIHAMTPSLVFAIYFTVIQLVVNEDNWTVGKEILVLSTFLLFVGVVQFLIRDIIYDNPLNWSWRYFYEEIRNTYMVGMLFMSILIPINYNRLNQKNVEQANRINDKPRKSRADVTINEEDLVELEGESILIDQLLFAKAEGNYVKVLVSDNPSRQILSRTTLKELEDRLNRYTQIVKTHRSYLVNTNHLTKVKGNAQGYKLQLKNLDMEIPVSRNMIDFFNTRVRQN